MIDGSGSTADAAPVLTPGWEVRTTIVSVTLFLMTAAFVIGRTARDALYFLGDGLHDLPGAYLGIAILSLPVSALALGVLRWMGVRRGRVAITFATVGALLAYSAVARPGGGALMTTCFSVLPLAFGVMFSVGWLFGADLLDRAPRGLLPRAYGWIGASSIAGGAVGGLAARLLAPSLPPAQLFVVAAALVGVSGFMILLGHYRCPFRRQAAPGGHPLLVLSELRSLMQHRYVFRLLTVGMIAGLVGVLVEFQFFVSASRHSHDMHLQTAFFANVYFVFNAAALTLQLFAMARLQRRFGVEGSLMVLPWVLTAGAVTMLASASAAARAWVRIAEGSIKSSIHRSNWEQAYLPIARSSRGATKLMVDGVGARLAEGVGAGVIFVWLRVSAHPDGSVPGVSWVTWLLLAAVLSWLVLARRLGSEIVRCFVSPDPRADFHWGAPLPEG